jgi:hypothetical protein
MSIVRGAFLALALALACAPVLAETPDARKTLEKAAYAEEHDRDFDGAAKLYEQAAKEAADAKDDATEKEAKAGLARIQERLGKKPKDAPVPLAVRRRIYALLKEADYDSGHPTANQAASELPSFGVSAVPMLVQALLGEPIADPDGEDSVKNEEATVQAYADALARAQKAFEAGVKSSQDVAQARQACGMPAAIASARSTARPRSSRRSPDPRRSRPSRRGTPPRTPT